MTNDNLPPGYVVFELEWRGCWHFRGPDDVDHNACEKTRDEAVAAAWDHWRNSRPCRRCLADAWKPCAVWCGIYGERNE